MYSHVLSLFLSFKGLSTVNLLSNVSDGRPRPLLWETNKKFTGTFSNPLSLLAAPLFSLHDIAPLLLILISVHPLRALPFLPSRCTRPSFFCSWCVFQRLGEQLAGVPGELWGYQIKWIIDPAYDSNVLFFHHFFFQIAIVGTKTMWLPTFHRLSDTHFLICDGSIQYNRHSSDMLIHGLRFHDWRFPGVVLSFEQTSDASHFPILSFPFASMIWPGSDIFFLETHHLSLFVPDSDWLPIQFHNTV